MKSISKTFRLKPQSVKALEELVRSGRAESQTAMLEILISREKLRLDMHLEEQELDQAWQAAMSSPEYRSELLQLEAEFAEADAESARNIR